MAHEEFVQIPADGTGKRIRHSVAGDLEITNITATNIAAIAFGDVITFSTSGVTARFSGSNTLHGVTTLTVYDFSSTTIVSGETVTNSDHGDLGEAAGSEITKKFTPSITLTDPDSPSHKQKIDKDGSIFTRFTEGKLPFDAFGHAQYSQQTVIDSHTFLYNDFPLKYWDNTAGGGTVAPDLPNSSLLFSNGTASGDLSQRTTNQYYPYEAGIGTEFLFSLAVGDQGKANVRRRWGVFDDDDGIFFELDGTTMCVVLRNSTGGVVSEERVEEINWNLDPLLNADTDSFVLDVSKANLYFIDYQ